jgi:hypothetical protein
MHAVIQIIFYIDHIKNEDNWVSTILDMQISKCNVISGYAMIDSLCGLIHAVIPLKEEYYCSVTERLGNSVCEQKGRRIYNVVAW